MLGWILGFYLLVASPSFAQGKATSQGRGLANAAQRASAAAASGMQTANAAKDAAGAAQRSAGASDSGKHHDASTHGIRRGLGAGVSRIFSTRINSDAAARRFAEPIADLPDQQEDGSPTLETFDRTRQHRLDQAEHLRGISERNGNAALLDTADRMEASAERNYLRQTETLSSPPTEEVQPDESIPEVGEIPEVVTEQVVPRRRGFWIRSR
jgi:hypothetical protein